jgi:hypothetical protein
VCVIVKNVGLAILDPKTTADENWTTSTAVCVHLIAALRGTEVFRSMNHNHIMAAGQAEMRLRKTSTSDVKLDYILNRLEATGVVPSREDSTLGPGVWLSALPSTVNGPKLSAQEFRDAISIRYGITPSNLPTQCDGCDARFTLQHALGCKKSGLVIFRHNKIRDELIHLAGKAFTPSAICGKPLLQGCGAENTKTCRTNCASANKPVNKDDHGDILLLGSWARGTECIVNVQVTDTDAPSYQTRSPVSVLKLQEKEKKWKYLEACLEQRRHFTPFVVLTDGMMGRKASTFAKAFQPSWPRSGRNLTCGYANISILV